MENTGNNGGQTPQKNSKKKWLLGGLGVLALGALTYFGIDYYTKNKSGNKKNIPATKPRVKVAVKKQAAGKPKKKVVPKTKVPTKPVPKKETVKQKVLPKKEATFPLSIGDSGTLVKNLQVALITKFGENVLPKDKDSGVFGQETENVLRTLKVPVVKGRVIVTKAKYEELVRPDPRHSENLANFFRLFITDNYFRGFLGELKNLRNVEDYKSVNSFFVKKRTGLTHQTLLNAAFSTFKDLKDQQQLRFEFLRIGLHYDGSNWSLQGTKNTPLIITTMATTVWKDAKTSIAVPHNMVLGTEITRRGDFTLFENNKLYFLVESKSVKQYQK